MMSGRGTRPRRVVADQVHADVLRSGEHDAVDVGVLDQLLAGGAAAAGDEVEDAGRDARFRHHFVQLVAEERRGRRRLEHDGVAGDERAARGSRRQRQREVERRDHRPDAVRPQDAGVFFVGPERAERRGEAGMLLDLVAVVLNQIGRFLDVADAFETVLAGFVAHQRRQLPPPRPDAVGDFLEQRHALGPRPRAPGGKRRLRGGDRLARLLAAGLLKRAEQDPRVDGAAVLELAAGPNLAAADHQRITPAERRPHALDRAIQLAMDIFHPIARHRRVGDFGISHCPCLPCLPSLPVLPAALPDLRSQQSFQLLRDGRRVSARPSDRRVRSGPVRRATLQA